MKKSFILLLVTLLLITTFGCSQKQQQEEQTDSDTAVVKTVEIGENEMDYIVFGKGEKTFVIIPGLSVHSVMPLKDSIAEAYKDFTEEYTVYLFDRPKNLEEGCTIEDLAEATSQAMINLGIENADIFGASQGGMIAQYIAIDHPELVHKLILGSTLSKPNETFSTVGQKWVELAENKDEQGLLENFVDVVYSQATLDQYRDTLIESNKGITDEEYARFIILAKSCLTFDCYDKLDQIKCDVLVLGCEGDKVVTVEGSKEIADKLNCEIYIYDDSYGHGVYDEASDYKQRCLDFLNK